MAGHAGVVCEGRGGVARRAGRQATVEAIFNAVGLAKAVPEYLLDGE